MQQVQQETRLIHCYDAVSFVIEVEKAVKEGFSLDLVTPQNYPQQIGFQFITTMVRTQEQPVKGVAEPVEASKIEQVVQSTMEELQEVVEAPKKAGRPAKGK